MLSLFGILDVQHVRYCGVRYPVCWHASCAYVYMRAKTELICLRGVACPGVERLCICIFGLYRRYTNRIIIIIIIIIIIYILVGKLRKLLV